MSKCNSEKCSAISSSTNKRCRNNIKEGGLCNIHLKKTKLETIENSEDDSIIHLENSDDESVHHKNSDNAGPSGHSKHSVKLEDSYNRMGSDHEEDSDHPEISDDLEISDHKSHKKILEIEKNKMKSEITNEIAHEIKQMREMHDKQMKNFALTIDMITNKIGSMKIKDATERKKKNNYTQKSLINRARMEHYHHLKNDVSVISTIHQFYEVSGIVKESVNKHLIKVYLDRMFDQYEETAKHYFIEMARIHFTKE